ncbi:uncharacterized protein LOC135168586 [Diachasmimorpha longicaudata]|uniref:uncharacterized protein LOC135168586 n=1 Tax=Diachasmimorpha longicaudata TaxID=58733 RepID=UPI0030B89654
MLPELWTTDPDNWFIHIEAQFALRNIRNDNTMYQAVVARDGRPPQAPPSIDKYSWFKTNLVKHFSDSVDRQLYKLLIELPLGNRMPSQLLREMRILAGNRASEELLRNCWLASFPELVSRILKAAQDSLINSQKLLRTPWRIALAAMSWRQTISLLCLRLSLASPMLRSWQLAVTIAALQNVAPRTRG